MKIKTEKPPIKKEKQKHMAHGLIIKEESNHHIMQKLLFQK